MSRRCFGWAEHGRSLESTDKESVCDRVSGRRTRCIDNVKVEEVQRIGSAAGSDRIDKAGPSEPDERFAAATAGCATCG